MRAPNKTGWLCALLLLGACETSGATSSGTVNPQEGAGNGQIRPEGVQEGEGPEELRLRLARLVEQRGAIVKASAEREAKRCENLCELAASICGVQVSLCELADEHAGDEAYQQLCREAKQECKDANQSCVACVEQNKTQSQPAPAPASPRPEGEGTATAPQKMDAKTGGGESPNK